MQLTMNIPDSIPMTLNIDLQELTQTMKLSTALMLFKKSKLSIEQASHLANLSIYNFMKECHKNQIPVISYEEGELEDELQLMKNL